MVYRDNIVGDKNVKNVFLHHVKDNKLINEMTIYDAINNNCEDFYYVCRKFADIGLNAPKLNQDGNIKVFFRPEDIENAKEAAKTFYIEKNISEIDEYLEAIKELCEFAVEIGDSKSAVILNDKGSKDSSNIIYGTYYNFAKFPKKIGNGLQMKQNNLF